MHNLEHVGSPPRQLPLRACAKPAPMWIDACDSAVVTNDSARLPSQPITRLIRTPSTLGTLPTLVDVRTITAVSHNVTTEERVEGAPAFRAHVAAIHDRWPNLSFEEHGVYFAADTGVVEWTVRGTAPDGLRLEWDGIDVINCRDGKITRNAVYSSGHAPRVLAP